ncbi:LysR family transcriptional regulator [Ramlibacter tataouinensis]|uniref:Transcriptional regulator, LysR family-like protein n=1 Tax=Ramlibacter tataouinensis (strain ATCC BAA-407 / DSM 14655 / LMG 21543 / TTB310) TaxID=365046 RepID=F5Y4U1_RAMTT|nr:LysR family transcriptional regulator [Ramlibacter tataouinensis]AEG92597.1 transcriptional regulator, LysR family-like protein [Ramlibacter tataouinensis TTB310]
MPTPRDVLTPDTLALLQAVARTGSFAAAARELGLVPSAVTYRVRLVEDALDALLFDRSSRQARLTDAGAELLREGERLLDQVDAVANRVRRVATGWETQLTLSIDGLIVRDTVLELCQAFFDSCPPTRLRLRDEVLTGTVEALRNGQADLALGFAMDPGTLPGLHHQLLGEVEFVFAVAPHHPLARHPEPLPEEVLRSHRAVAVADSTQRGHGMSIGLLAGQEVFTVPTMALKLDAQLRGLGAGFLPEPAARPFIESGRLVVRQTERPRRVARLHYAWRSGNLGPGQGLQWWLNQLESPATRRALLERRRG